MSHLIKRSLREIKSNLTQFVSIVLIIAVGSAIFSGLFSTITLLSSYLDAYYTDYKMADAWMYVKGLTPETVRDLQTQFPDLLIEARRHIDVESVLKGESVTLRFITRTSLNDLKMEAGTRVLESNDVLVDASFADKNGLKLGDTLSVTLNGHANRYTVVGLFNSPEYAYKSVDFSDASSNKQGFGILIARDAEVELLIKQTESYETLKSDLLTQLDEAQIKLDDAQATLDSQQSKLTTQIDQFNRQKAFLPIPQVQAIAAQFKSAQSQLDTAQVELSKAIADFNTERADALHELDLYPKRTTELLVAGSASDIQSLDSAISKTDDLVKDLAKADHPAYAMVNNILKPIEVMTTIFPILFFVVSAIVILISMSKTVQNERMQIAIFRGLGLSSTSIVLSYLWYGWWAALLGAIPFALAGNYVIPKVLVAIFTTRFSFPAMPLKFYPLYVLLAVVTALFFASLAIVLAIRPILKEIPAQGMRPQAPKATRRSILEKMPKLWKKLSYTTKLILRNFQVSKIKLLLSSIGIVGSVALLITGLGLRFSAGSMIGGATSTYAFDYAIRLESDMSIQDVVFPEFVTRVEPTAGVSGRLEGENVGLSFYPAHTQLMTFTSNEGQTLDLGSDDVWVTTILAHNFDLKVGDTINVEVDDVKIPLVLTGITNQYLGKDVILSLDHAQRLGLETSTSRYILKSNESVSSTDQELLLANDAIAAVDTKAKFKNSANEIMGMLNRIITIIVLSALILSVTVIYNLASINIFERRRELATLRVLGYTVTEVGHLIYTENYILWGLGVLGGVPAGIFLFQTIAHMVSTPEFLMMDVLQPQTLGLVVLLSFVFTWLTNRLLGVKLRRIEFVESLKGVE